MKALLILFIFIFSITITDCSNNTVRLYQNLLQHENYNPQSRPVRRHEDIVLLYMNLSLIQIIDVDEKNQITSLRVIVNQEWKDPNFIWNPKEYGNITEIQVPSQDIWTPDLALYNNAGGDWNLASSSNAKVVVKHDGSVVWKPSIIYKSQCEIDVEYFPFDIQNCSLKIGLWTYDGNLIDLRHTAQKSDPFETFDNCERHIDFAVDLSSYIGDVEWDLLSVEARRNVVYYPCCVEPFLDLRFYLVLRRRILFYGVNLICPCLAISFLTILVFYLPADSGEKISLSINVLISLTVFFMLIFDISPPTSLVVPLILRYLLFTMILITLSVVMTVILLNIHWRSPETYTVPGWARKILMEKLPKLLLMKKPNSPKLEAELNPDENSDCSETFDKSRKCQVDETFWPKLITRRKAIHSRNGIDQVELCLEGCRHIVDHVKKRNQYKSIRDDWKYIAMVLNRLFLVLFSITAVIGMFGIFIQSPTLSDSREPLSAENCPDPSRINVTRLLCKVQSSKKDKTLDLV